jgi:hypothetical protein
MAKKLFFNEYSDLTQQHFKDTNDIHIFGKICVDTYKNQLQGQSVPQANMVIREKFRKVAGLPENPTDLQIRRAFKKSSVREAVFEILEETLDQTLITGWGSDPWFNKYVDFKTMALGQKNSFYIKSDDLILNVSKISGGHHNIERQRLGRGTERAVATSHYGAKVYMEMSRFLQGVEDWNELIDGISRAFTIRANREIHDQVMSAVNTLPVPSKWNQKGLAITSNKKAFKGLIADVKRATGSTAVIMGTEVGLGELTGFADVNWISDGAKNDVYTMGRIGSFEGTTIVELPNPFDYNNEEAYLEDDTKVIVMPGNIDKFVKFYYEGADEIVEHSELADNGDDTKDYEFQTVMGIETITNRRFGVWTFQA